MLYKELNNIEDREYLPLDGPGNYRVVNNKVITNAIEVNVSRHCNLSCRGCSHSSPISKLKVYNIDILNNDLSKLSIYMHSRFIRLVGGEPLLVNNLLDILKTIKDSNISDSICLVTNGLLLDKLNAEELELIDKVEISFYPLDSKLVDNIMKNVKRLIGSGKKVRLLDYSYFRESIVKERCNDTNLIKSIYETCGIAHKWRCITLDNGRLYRCPQSMIYSEKNNIYLDSLSLDDITSIDKLLLFLENNTYLYSCSSCLGSVGKKFVHEQVNRNEWESYIPDTITDGIDLDYMDELQKQKVYSCDCMKRNKLN